MVIFDEASQVTPGGRGGSLDASRTGGGGRRPAAAAADELLRRRRQAVDDDDEDVEDELSAYTGTKNMESILDAMGALLPPPIGTKRLSWHYRSRDERLIAFSNAQPQLYDWSLTTFPGRRRPRLHHAISWCPSVPGRVDQEQSVADEVTAGGRSCDRARPRPSRTSASGSSPWASSTWSASKKRCAEPAQIDPSSRRLLSTKSSTQTQEASS